MPINTYYLSKTKEGEIWFSIFPQTLQEAAASGGGLNLPGSMVQWIDDHGNPVNSPPV